MATLMTDQMPSFAYLGMKENQGSLPVEKCQTAKCREMGTYTKDKCGHFTDVPPGQVRAHLLREMTVTRLVCSMAPDGSNSNMTRVSPKMSMFGL